MVSLGLDRKQISGKKKVSVVFMAKVFPRG